MAGSVNTTMSVSEVVEKVAAGGMARDQAAILVSEWIKGVYGHALVTFDYATAFPQAVVACGAAFARSFQHADWVDGESVVQAGETPSELGFNVRFHQIEADLDALGADVAKAFACLAEQRRTLRLLLDEVKTEINRINRAIYDCCGSGVTVRPYEPVYPGYEYYPPPRYVVPLPSVGDPWVNIRLGRAGLVARYVEEHRPQLDPLFGPRRNVTVKVVLDALGGDVVDPGGLTLRQALEILPADAAVKSADELRNLVADREAAALRTAGTGEREALAGALGLPAGTKDPAAASIASFGAVAPDARVKLAAAGVKTLGDLAGASAADLVRKGVARTAGEAAAWIGIARTVRGIG